MGHWGGQLERAEARLKGEEAQAEVRTRDLHAAAQVALYRPKSIARNCSLSIARRSAKSRLFSPIRKNPVLFFRSCDTAFGVGA
eukprot:1188462-Rhodomonas_salina.1